MTGGTGGFIGGIGLGESGLMYGGRGGRPGYLGNNGIYGGGGGGAGVTFGGKQGGNGGDGLCVVTISYVIKI